MGQRNMLCTSQMIDLELDQQGQGHFHPEPCVLFGSVTNFQPPNIHSILRAPGNTTNFNVHHIPEHHDSTLFYGMTQYNGVQHHHPAASLDLTVGTAFNYCNPYMAPSSGTRVFPVPLNHGPHDLPSSSNHGIIGVCTDDYGRNNHFMDGVGGSFKRKNAEGIPGNFQYCNASAGSSSSVAPLHTRPLESGVTLMDAASFARPEYNGNDISSIMEIASRNRPGVTGLDSVLAHNPNHLIQGNYVGQPFQMASTPWLDQQFSSNGGDGGSFSWNQAPALTYLHGSNVNGGCIEAGNIGVQGYQETANNGNSRNFLHLPPIHQGHHNLHHPPPPMQGVRGHNINIHSQVAASSHRYSTNNASHTSTNPLQDGVEVGPRYVGSVPPTGLRIYRPQRRGVMPEATPRHHNLPHLRVLPADEVAILEISGYYEVGNSIDHHRDMRLDIDHMSYEELLALGEHIGNVGTGLSEETIMSHLKMRTYVPSTTCINLEEAACVDQEPDFCVVCQTDYQSQEKIGTLDCGHEYHLDCIKKWLLVKNACPICKSAALTTERGVMQR
uniref:RING-type E3 ubiquitin transferase n=1 Tax=Davidia involucrata TaxID=16924 RepID=A0A5B7AFC5_DAVIN